MRPTLLQPLPQITLSLHVTRLCTVVTAAFANDFFYGLATGQLFGDLSTGQQQATIDIVRVEFFDRDRKLGDGVKQAPGDTWSLPWSQPSAGVHSLRALVTDALGLVTEPEAIPLTVNRQSGHSENKTPLAEITGFGADQTMDPPASDSQADPGAGANRPRILKTGLATLFGKMYDGTQTAPDTFHDSSGLIYYQFLLFSSDGQFVANVTPGALASGYASRGVKADAYNNEFVTVFEELLREVWIAIANVNNTSGPNPKDEGKIANIVANLQNMLMSRRANGNVKRGVCLCLHDVMVSPHSGV